MENNKLILRVFGIKNGLYNFEEIIECISQLVYKQAATINRKNDKDFYQTAYAKISDVIDNFKFINLIDELKNIKSKDELEAIAVNNQKVNDYLFSSQNCFLYILKKALRKAASNYVVQNKQWWNVTLFDDESKLAYYGKHVEPKKINDSALTESDKEFLSHFIVDGKIITQKEVAKKLNISQQAVSKRLKKIREKLNK